MILGYDEKRPTEKNYHSFVQNLVDGLKKYNNEEISLMLYGSYVRGDYVAGRSDIDAVLVFPYDVLIDKNVFLEVSKIINYAQQENNIPFQVTPTDLRTMKDGRFNSFDPNFKQYFNNEGKIFFGSDYRDQFTYCLSNHSDQNALRFNLRKSRSGLLFSEHDKYKYYKTFLERFNKTLDAVSRGSKQILTMMDGKLRKNRFSALEELSEIFPEVNLEPLRKIKILYHNLEELDKIYRNSKDLIKIWGDSVSFFESLIKLYIDRF